jgi:hypothetical protein
MKIIEDYIKAFINSDSNGKSFNYFLSFIYNYYGEKINKTRVISLKNKYICVRAKLLEYVCLKEKEITKSIQKHLKNKIR